MTGAELFGRAVRPLEMSGLYGRSGDQVNQPSCHARRRSGANYLFLAMRGCVGAFVAASAFLASAALMASVAVARRATAAADISFGIRGMGAISTFDPDMRGASVCRLAPSDLMNLRALLLCSGLERALGLRSISPLVHRHQRKRSYNRVHARLGYRLSGNRASSR